MALPRLSPTKRLGCVRASLVKHARGNFLRDESVQVNEALKRNTADCKEEPAMLKKLAALAFALGLFATQALPAFACGALVAPDGSVRLARATTLVAWHDGVEHYLSSFRYQGDFSNLGWIVPLPAVPMKIEEGGAWTLQRLERETHPVKQTFGAVEATASSDAATVLQQVKIEALNITVIRGSGSQVLNWATGNGFFLNADTRAHLLVYAKGSPIFLAAKYDTAAAKARNLLQGDGTPILIT